MKTSEFLVFLVFFTIIVILIVVNRRNVVYLKSDTDNFVYEVQNTEEKEKVVNMLARIRDNITVFTNKLYSDRNKYPKYKKYIERLYRNIQGVQIYETPVNSDNTSYTINKGEQIAFCVRSKSTGKLHDFNLMMYVVLHELGHVACPEYDHTPLFWDIFRFITKRAIEMDLYTKINFNMLPQEYCGMDITSSVI